MGEIEELCVIKERSLKETGRRHQYYDLFFLLNFFTSSIIYGGEKNENEKHKSYRKGKIVARDY